MLPPQPNKINHRIHGVFFLVGYFPNKTRNPLEVDVLLANPAGLSG